MKKRRRWLYPEHAKKLGFTPKKNYKGRSQASYYLSEDQIKQLHELRGDKNAVSVKTSSSTDSNSYKDKKAFVLSAWNSKGYMMDIDEYCDHYKLPRKDIDSYKLVSHTGTPFYNIVFKERKIQDEMDEGFIASIVQKYATSLQNVVVKNSLKKITHDFDVLTFTDVHIGMDTDKYQNTMYKNPWNKKVLMRQAKKMVEHTLSYRKSKVLYIDDLGDLLDGQDGKTTRKGHDLPQNMTNEEMFDAAFEFKIYILDNLAPYYEKIIFNNICNDNHAGSFGYYTAKMLQEVSKIRYTNVKVVNHRKFINHYFAGDVAFLISHGKDDKSLKFGFKVHLDAAGLEKIDQYCKRHEIYKKAKLVVFKKGDSHQALFDWCTSDDFYYYNYPAFSPSSNWIKNNFKLGRRGFFVENYKGLEVDPHPYFFKDVG